MTQPNAARALKSYGQVGAESGVSYASPHRLIHMLIEGALDKIAIARGAIERRDYAAKARHISWAISIIEGLRLSLDKNAGGELAENLEGLYLYMNERLLAASAEQDVGKLEEVAGLLRELKAGWEAIEQQTTAVAP